MRARSGAAKAAMNAFVFSGGGNLGAVQAGMLEALFDTDVRPDFLVGTSIGAANAAFIAADPSLERARELSEVWRKMRARDVFPLSPLRAVRALTRGGALFSPEPLRSLLEREIPYRLIEKAPVPVRIIATRFDDGEEAVFASGSVTDAVLASTALPGAFPPYEIAGSLYLDGGLSDHVPLQPAVDGGADTIYVLSVGFPCPPPARHHSSLALLAHSAGILLSQRTRLDEVHLPLNHPWLRIVRIPSICAQLGLRDFSRTSELIARAKEQTARFLAGEDCTACDHQGSLNHGAHILRFEPS